MRKSEDNEMKYSEEFNLLGIIPILYKWRWAVIWLSVGAGVLTAFISLTLPDYYKATTIFLAASPDQAQPEILFNKVGTRSFVYGTENDLDRIMTIAESTDLVNFLIDSFHLFEHYKINPDKKKARYKVRKKFFKYYELQKTSRDAIELSFEDKDPEFAAKVANAAREKIDFIGQSLLSGRLDKVIQTFESSIVQKTNILHQISDSLQVLRNKYKIFNPTSQTENISAQYDDLGSNLVRNKSRLALFKENKRVHRDTVLMLEALVKGMEDEMSALKLKMEELNAGMPQVLLYEKQYYEANQTLSDDQERLKEYKSVRSAQIPATILIEHAEAPEMKSRPRRSIFVILSGVIAFIFSVFGVLVIEAYKDIDWRKLIHAD